MKDLTVNAVSIILECKSRASEDLESDVLEFKAYKDHKSLCESKELADEVVAFANSGGGTIIVGVKDSSNVTFGEWHTQLAGIAGVDMTEFGERLRGKIKPSINITIRSLTIDQKKYIVIRVPNSPNSLVSTSSGKVYKRSGRSSMPMSPDEITQAVKALQTYDWSDQEADVGLSALSTESVEEARLDYCERRKVDKDQLDQTSFLEAIGATRNGKLNKSGLLMFGGYKSIREELGLYEYRFSWKSKGGALIVNDVWNGNLWATIARFRKHFESCNSKIPFEFKGREYSAPLFDSVAFHEALMNSLVHQDYTAEGMVVVDYDSSRMKISNPGKFYGGVTPQNITHHQPRHRNKCLASLLMTFQLVDRAGMGIKRMGRQSLMYGRKFPRFSERNDSVTVTMHGEALRPGIFVVGQNEQYGLNLPQFYVLNLLYEVGFLLIDTIEQELSAVFDMEWDEIIDAIESIQHVHLCGTKDGVYVRVDSKWNDFYEVSKSLKTHSASSKYVSLYKLIRRCGTISNEDVRKLLAHKSCSQTSQFLRSCKFLVNSGSGTTSKWDYVHHTPNQSQKRKVDSVLIGFG